MMESLSLGCLLIASVLLIYLVVKGAAIGFVRVCGS